MAIPFLIGVSYGMVSLGQGESNQLERTLVRAQYENAIQGQQVKLLT